MQLRNSRYFIASALMAAAIVPATAETQFDRIVVFGTSLSDSGNAFALRGDVNVPPDYLVDPFLVPTAPYARGGHHFSNGATWVEQFARPLGLAGSVKPAFMNSSAGAANYAVAGARAYEDGVNLNLSAQVGAFLQGAGGVAPAGRLYVIEMGGNDIRDALVAFAGGGNGAPVLQQAVASIAQNIQTLYAAGARTFLVWRPPNVGSTPAIRTLDQIRPGAAQLATSITQAFNAGLDGAVAQLSALPGIRMVRLDAYALLNDISSHPAAFGLTNVTSACITPGIPPFTCDSPDEYLFWDGIHPSRAVHAITAQAAAYALMR
jgi:phospholipase/lecithinase/hemolysin